MNSFEQEIFNIIIREFTSVFLQVTQYTLKTMKQSFVMLTKIIQAGIQTRGLLREAVKF